MTQNLFGTTRSSVASNHALFAEDSLVMAALDGWENTKTAVLISPHLGARFSQYLAYMEANASAQFPATDIERVLFVIEGSVTLEDQGSDKQLHAGGYVFFPAGCRAKLVANGKAWLNVFEKRRVGSSPVGNTKAYAEQEQNITGAIFCGDDTVTLKTLLPKDQGLDLEVNLFTFSPGATLPYVETHVMEHGLLMLEGQGVYRLGERWYPVQKGDVIWMGSYCPQWFVAMGKTPVRYLYYKDVIRSLF